MSIAETTPDNVSPEQYIVTELDRILSRPLRPEYMETYASDAVQALGVFAEMAIEGYRRQPTVEMELQAQEEDAAFSYFRLRDIPLVLDHLSQLSQSIHRAYEASQTAVVENVVYLPQDLTDTAEMPITKGSGYGRIEQGKQVERLAAVLFLINHVYQIDIHDAAQVQLSMGMVRGNTMRRVSYAVVSVPRLNCTMLVCDQGRNATFMFDRHRTEALGYPARVLATSTKGELRDLIEREAGIGRSITYSDHYLEHILRAIDGMSPQSVADLTALSGGNTTAQFLYPAPPKGVLACEGIVRYTKLGRPLVQRAIEAARSSMGPVYKYRFWNQPVEGFTPEQQLIVLETLDKWGLFLPLAPKDILSQSGVAHALHRAEYKVEEAIAALGNSLGETKRYRWSSNLLIGYTEQQRRMIKEYIDQHYPEVPPRPGYYSARAIAGRLHVDKKTVGKYIRMYRDEIGEGSYCTIRYRDVETFSPDQQDIIAEKLRQHGILRQPRPKE